MTTYPSETKDRFIVRLPDGWRAKLKSKAQENHRSMNSEVLAILEPVLHEEAEQNAEA